MVGHLTHPCTFVNLLDVPPPQEPQALSGLFCDNDSVYVLNAADRTENNDMSLICCTAFKCFQIYGILKSKLGHARTTIRWKYFLLAVPIIVNTETYTS